MMCNSKNAIKIVVNVVFMHIYMPMFFLTKNNCGQTVTERKRELMLFRLNSSLIARVGYLPRIRPTCSENEVLILSL